MGILFFERQTSFGNIAEVIIDRVSAMNAIDFVMSQSLFYALESWVDNASVSAIIIRSVSDSVFCAGADLNSLILQSRIAVNVSNDFLATQYKILHLLRSSELPVVVMASGVVAGFGAGLLMAASHKVCDAGIRFSMPECAIGFFMDVGASKFLHMLPSDVVADMREMALEIGANHLLEAGMIDYIVDFSKFDDWLRVFFEKGCVEEVGQSVVQPINSLARSCAKDSVGWSSLLYDFARDLDYQDLLNYEYALAREFLSFSNFSEGVNSFLEKRSPNWSSSYMQPSLENLHKIYENYDDLV